MSKLFTAEEVIQIVRRVVRSEVTEERRIRRTHAGSGGVINDSEVREYEAKTLRGMIIAAIREAEKGE